ncbi:MAG: hypothetical protein SPE99_03025 [Blautia sp.]|nr:hypothetical protein [Blautia sp.]
MKLLNRVVPPELFGPFGDGELFFVYHNFMEIKRLKEKDYGKG